MQILTRDSLPLGGFGGLTEHRLVTDSRIFAGRKSPDTWEGLGQFVYLADAKFNPKGETGMHPHLEIDVITIMIDGQVAHEGSLEHGKGLQAGDVQVQRAGGEGFSHNEVNPDETKNRLIQVWALPEEAGRPAGYKHYTPATEGTTRIYGGSKQQQDTFDSSTLIDIVNLSAGESYSHKSAALAYLTKGSAVAISENETAQVKDGDLVRAESFTIEATEATSIILVHQ